MFSFATLFWPLGGPLINTSFPSRCEAAHLSQPLRGVVADGDVGEVGGGVIAVLPGAVGVAAATVLRRIQTLDGENPGEV